MKRLLPAIFFTFTLISLTKAQTWTRMQGWGLDLESVHWVNDQKVFAVGENLIIYSDNAGVTWNEVEQKFEGRFFDITFLDQSRGFVVGENGQILKSSDGGKSWTKIETGNSGTLRNILSTANNQLIASGENGVLIASEDSGNSWKVIPTNTTLDLQDIFFTTDNTGFIAAEGGTLFKTTDKGLTWNPIQLNTLRNLNSVVFTDQQNGYAVGDQGVFFRSTDGGNSWVSLTTNVSANLTKVVASPLDPKIAIAVGEQATLIRTTNSGTNFTAINLGAGNTRKLSNLGFRPNSTTLYAVGQDGYLIFSNNSGQTWTVRQAGIRNDFSSADFKSTTFGFIAGKNGEFYVTNNAGSSLISRPLPEKTEIISIDFWNTSFGYVSSVGGKMYRTSNSGTAWVPVPTQNQSDITGFYLFAPSVLYISGSNGYISRSFDSGVTWDQTVVSNTQTDFRDLTYFDFVFGFAIGKNGQISRSAGGSIWESRPKITSENLNALAKLDTTTAIVVGNNGTVLKTIDKAVTWQVLPFPEKVNLTSVDFWDTNLGFVVGEKGMIFQTKDGGKSWFQLKSGTVRDLLSVNYGDPNSAFAVGKDGTLLSYTCIPPGSVSPISGNSVECLGESVYSINSLPETTSEIVWRVDGGIIISGQGTSRIEIEWTKPGRNAVLVSRSNFCGNGETSALEVQVNQKPSLSTAISGEGSVCVDSNNSYSIPNQSGITYAWEVSGGEIESGQGTSTISVKWKSTGDQKISVVASNACGKSEAKTKIIRAAKAPDQPAAIQGESLVPLAQTIYQTVAIPGLNYRWNISAGGKILSGQGTASVSVLWEKEGKFELSVEAQNECNFGPKRVLPVTVSVITALEPDPLNDQLTVFPNPSEGKVTLRSPGLDSFELVQVVNSFGQILYESAILSGDTRHDLVDIPRGVHLIRLSGKKGVLSRKLMVK